MEVRSFAVAHWGHGVAPNEVLRLVIDQMATTCGEPGVGMLYKHVSSSCVAMCNRLKLRRSFVWLAYCYALTGK